MKTPHKIALRESLRNFISDLTDDINGRPDFMNDKYPDNPYEHVIIKLYMEGSKHKFEVDVDGKVLDRWSD